MDNQPRAIMKALKYLTYVGKLAGFVSALNARNLLLGLRPLRVPVVRPEVGKRGVAYAAKFSFWDELGRIIRCRGWKSRTRRR